jgi:oligopeptidase B
MNPDTIPLPKAARIERKQTTLHGITLDYAWLRDKESPEVRAFLEAENAYADAVTAPLSALRDTLYEEMLSHIKQTDVSVPFRDGAWWYYARTEETLQYAISCRKRGDAQGPAADAPEEVILDGNKLAEGHAFFAIGATDITDDGRWLAYTTDTTGFRQYTLHIKDLEPARRCRGRSSAWARWSGLRTIARCSTPSRTRAEAAVPALASRAGQDHSADVLVYQDDDERFNLGAGRTRDGKYMVLESASHTTTESGCCRRRTRGNAVHAHQPRARTSTSTPSTIAMGCGSSAPTTKAQLPPGDGAGGHAGPRALDRADSAPRRRDDRGDGSLRRLLCACEREDGLPRLRVWAL